MDLVDLVALVALVVLVDLMFLVDLVVNNPDPQTTQTPWFDPVWPSLGRQSLWR